MLRFLLLAFISALPVARAWAAPPAPDRVTTESGVLQGAVTSDVVSFKGVPYAAPPVGPLRWRPPQPVQKWDGVRAATAYGHDCMQKPFVFDFAPLQTTPAEDCLVLNVWRAARPAAEKLPVMVWIHGGGFVNGGSSPAVYAGDAFARQGVLLVSINYRLGRFGFFGFPALTCEHAEEPKGNYGYMDQIAALKWVQRNIAAFGGDPHNVTVFGESAGGVSVHTLLSSPETQGLFTKAAVESGGGRDNLMGPRQLARDLPGLPSAETLGKNFAARYAIAGEDAAALAQLRALTAEQVTDGLDMMALFQPPAGAPTYGGPIVDGRIVVGTPREAYLAGRWARVPVLLGANDADIGLGDAKTLDEAVAPLGGDRAKVLAAYDSKKTGDVQVISTHIAMDRTMIEPARFAAAAIAARGVPAFEYRFGYVANSMKNDWKTGAPHASEIPYVFDTVAVKFGASLTAADETVARAANTYWANFAKTGDPNGPTLAHWPRYNAAEDRILVFKADATVASEADAWKDRLDLVAAAADAGYNK